MTPAAEKLAFWQLRRLVTAMLWASRIVGVIVGFAVGVYIGEVLWANKGDWTNVVPFGLAVVGWLAGSEIGRRLATRPAKS